MGRIPLCQQPAESFRKDPGNFMEFAPANYGTFPESVFAVLNDNLNCCFLLHFNFLRPSRLLLNSSNHVARDTSMVRLFDGRGNFGVLEKILKFRFSISIGENFYRFFFDISQACFGFFMEIKL